MNDKNADFIKDIIKKLEKIDYINPQDIPSIGLYMDQVTTFMDEHLKSLKRFEDDKMLTKTMINNYTKNNLLPSPEKKKYSREHMILLIYIYYFKNVLSISDIQEIINPLTSRAYKNSESNINMMEVYEEIFKLEKSQLDGVTKDMIKKYNKATEAFAGVKGEEKDFLTIFTFISELCFDVYLKKIIIERMIDSNFLNDFDKD